MHLLCTSKGHHKANVSIMYDTWCHINVIKYKVQMGQFNDKCCDLMYNSLFTNSRTRMHSILMPGRLNITSHHDDRTFKVCAFRTRIRAHHTDTCSTTNQTQFRVSHYVLCERATNVSLSVVWPDEPTTPNTD